MAKLSPNDLLGRDVYGGDGHQLGAIRAITWNESNLFDGKVVIGNGESRLLALLRDLALEGERIVLRRSTREWLADQNPV